uniref:PB1 domain-containing protein n=1 Tax=Heterorhabditis bacteriophora TaxID=37862 RepID=A0A1I7WCS2_HETBA
MICKINACSVAMFSGGRKVKWNHFGKKYALRISDYEMEYTDLFDAFMKKVHEVRPDFEGALAYIDQYGRQVILSTDKDLREALHQSKGKLKLHTTLLEGSVIPAAEISGRPSRSQSVPPIKKYFKCHLLGIPTNTRHTDHTHKIYCMACRPIMECYSGFKDLDLLYFILCSFCRSKIYVIDLRLYYQSSRKTLMLILSLNIFRFLANPFPFGGYHRTFIGPNKYHQFGGWGGKYYSSGWGPVW